MTKEKFSKLILCDQAKYINKLIETGQSLSIICKNIGIIKNISNKII